MKPTVKMKATQPGAPTEFSRVVFYQVNGTFGLGDYHALPNNAYFIVAEALTNVAKHARARRAQVTAETTDGALHVQVRDDGVGGARSDGGGLLGLADRLGVLDGSLRVESPPDGGTLIAAKIPITGVKPGQ